jgi:hypothetical protein
MYHPYFRGKQYELITIRESAQLMKQAGFVPIIEPVKESFSGLKRALHAVAEEGGECVLVVNPQHGDYVGMSEQIEELLANDYGGARRIGAGIIADPTISLPEVLAACDRQIESRHVAIIHAGFPDGKDLARQLGERRVRHVFLEEFCGKLYRRAFRVEGRTRVLIRDGFQRRANRNHPKVEPFSELHATFREERMDGFGDYLIVGDEFTEGGGPAYAVAIHLTFIDRTQDEQMFIHHFVSDDRDTPTDPAGKFKQALDKLVREVDRSDTQVSKTKAVTEFLQLHENGHYPGLGYVKKLSMLHHIETLAEFFRREQG